MYPARSLARHTAAVMDWLRLPHEGLAAFDDTIPSLSAARADLAIIQEMNGSIEIIERVVTTVDHALTFCMAYDGHGEPMAPDAQAAYDDAEAALRALEQKLHIRARRIDEVSNKPNFGDVDVAAIEVASQA